MIITSGNLPWPEGGQSEFLFDQERIHFTLDHVSKRFPPPVIDLLRNCLVIDIHERASMAELLTYDVWDLIEPNFVHSKNGLINVQNMADIKQLTAKMEEKKDAGGRSSRKMVRRELTMEEYVDVIAGGAKLPNMKKNFMLEKEEMVKLRGAFTMGRLRRMTKKKE